jgi:antitoxin ParD1/3/4
MTVSLTPEVQKFVAEKVRARQYRSADEAVNALLAMTMQHERLTQEEMAELRAELDPATAEADRGEFVQFTTEDIIAEGRAGLSRKRQGA